MSKQITKQVGYIVDQNDDGSHLITFFDGGSENESILVPAKVPGKALLDILTARGELPQAGQQPVRQAQPARPLQKQVQQAGLQTVGKVAFTGTLEECRKYLQTQEIPADWASRLDEPTHFVLKLPNGTLKFSKMPEGAPLAIGQELKGMPPAQ